MVPNHASECFAQALRGQNTAGTTGRRRPHPSCLVIPELVAAVVILQHQNSYTQPIELLGVATIDTREHALAHIGEACAALASSHQEMNKGWRQRLRLQDPAVRQLRHTSCSHTCHGGSRRAANIIKKICHADQQRPRRERQRGSSALSQPCKRPWVLRQCCSKMLLWPAVHQVPASTSCRCAMCTLSYCPRLHQLAESDRACLARAEAHEPGVAVAPARGRQQRTHGRRRVRLVAAAHQQRHATQQHIQRQAVVPRLRPAPEHGCLLLGLSDCEERRAAQQHMERQAEAAPLACTTRPITF